VADHLAAMIQESAARFASRPAMRSSEDGVWRSFSYADLGATISSAAKALVDSGVRPGDLVGIFSPNRPEWTIADFAVMTVGAVSVPIYATNTARQAQFIVNDAELSVVFAGRQEQYDKLVSLRSEMPQLQRIVVFDGAAALTGEGSEHFADFLARGKAAPCDDEVKARTQAVTQDDLATLVYTSGTTGDPKGAMLTHGCFLHQFRALDERFAVGPEDTSLCFLPLSHVYERAWSFYVFASGAENCYVPDPRRVAEAMVEVKPSLMVSVPRLYEKVHATVVDRVERGPAAKARLFRWAVGVGGRYEHSRADRRAPGPLLRAEHALADRLVLSKIRDAVGGRKKVFSAGGAPLSKEIEEFFFAAGLLVCQGYGLTETTAMLTCNYPGAFRFGTVGTAVQGTELRITSDGEIQVRGGNVMKGYYHQPEATAAAFEDGWFRTGDVGAVDADGFVTVTDRIKDIIITSQGKNVAPQHVEGMIGLDPYIEQLVVVGDRRPYLTALVEPSFPMLERYAEEHGIPFASREELVARPEVKALYEERIAERSSELAAYERVKRFTLIPKELSQEDGQLTATLKLKRRVVEAEFAAAVDAMYDA
jgi:long-chain acyl-CoA synthetase